MKFDISIFFYHIYPRIAAAGLYDVIRGPGLVQRGPPWTTWHCKCLIFRPFSKIGLVPRISQACGRVLIRGFFDYTRSNCVGVVGGVSGSTLDTPVRKAWDKLGSESHPGKRSGAEFCSHVDCNLVCRPLRHRLTFESFYGSGSIMASI